MKTLLPAALLAAVVAAHAADYPAFNPGVAAPTLEERLAKARKAVGAQDWSGAMRELNVALREAPPNADVHNLVGYTWRKRAAPDMRKAFGHYNMALKAGEVDRGLQGQELTKGAFAPPSSRARAGIHATAPADAAAAPCSPRRP